MKELLVSRASLIWLLLMGATAVSLSLSGGPDPGSGAQGDALMLLLLAFFKVRLVVMHFMEAHDAIPALRWSGEAAVALIAGLVVMFYLYGDQIVAAGFPVN